MFEQLKHHPLANRILRRPPGLYGAARKQIAQIEKLEAAGRETFQNRQLERVLRVARDLQGYAANAKTANLRDWPILTKAAISGAGHNFTRRSILPHVPAATGGTTGQPLALARSWNSVAFEQAMIDHICAERGVDPVTARVAILRGDSIKAADDMTAPFWIDEGPSRRIFSAHHLSTQTISAFKTALASYAPGILFCYPSSLGNLLDLLGEDRSLRIPLIFASSEMLPPETLRRARDLLGADVIDFYGHAERIACAWSVNGEGYRFAPSYGLVELLPEGAGLARIVATSLHPRGQIFVRYDTGDLARVPSHDPAILREIALGIRAFAGIEGLDSEYIEIAGGRRVIGLNHIPRGVEGVASIQLHKPRKDEDVIDIYICAAGKFPLASQARLMANFHQKFPASVCARLIFVERPVRERNGKAPLLLRLPDEASIKPSLNHKCNILEQVA